MWLSVVNHSDKSGDNSAPSLEAYSSLQLSSNLSPWYYSSEVRRFLPLFGSYEHQTYDYASAMGELNRSARLGLEAIDEKALSLMLNALAQSVRFRKELHLEPWLGENSAVHSGHCVLSAVDMFRRADLHFKDAQSPEVTRMRLYISIGLLVHDMGEILGELSSLGQRLINSNIKELPQVERGIFASALHLAYYSAQSEQPSLFYGNIARLRQQTKIGKGETDLPRLKAALDRFNQELIATSYLTPENQSRVDGILNIYDAAELHQSASPLESWKIYCGHAVKVIEHLQGTRHFIRHCTKSDEHIAMRIYGTPTLPSLEETELYQAWSDRGVRTLPFSIAASARFAGGLKYHESSLHELFTSAKSPCEFALARAIRNGCWETAIELINANNYAVDRTVEKYHPEVSAIFEDIWKNRYSDAEASTKLADAEKILRGERARLINEHRQIRQQVGQVEYQNHLYPVETKARMMSLYWNAITNDITPPKGPLGLLPDLTDELRPLKIVPWHLRRQRVFA